MKLENIKYIIIVLLMGLSLFTTIHQQTTMQNGYIISFLGTLATIMLMIATIFLLWIEEPIGYTVSTALFTLAILNTAWLFYKINTFTVFAFGLLINTAGLVLSITRTEENQELETYELPKYKTETYDTETFEKPKRKYTRRQ